MPPKPVIPPKPNPNTPPQNPDPGRAGVPQEPGGGRTGQAGRVRQIADTINRTIGRTVDTTTKDSRRNGGPPLTHHTRVKLSPPSNRGNCPQSALSSSSSSSSSSSPSPSSSFTPSNQERERMMKTGVGVHRPEQFNPSHLSEERNRSEPDGSEEDVYERLTDEQCSAAPPAEEEKHCHCVCHLQIPGMKLVWVPTSEEESEKESMDRERKVKNDQAEKREQMGDVKQTREGKKQSKEQTDGKNSRAVPENSCLSTGKQGQTHSQDTAANPPTNRECINCRSFRRHHGPMSSEQCRRHHGPVSSAEEADSVYEVLDVTASLPPVFRPRSHLYSSSSLKLKPSTKSRSLQTSSESNNYVDVLPALENPNVSPPVPNPAYTPPERRKLPPLPVQTERKRTTQPALAYMLSPRGGRPPRSTQSSHTSTVKHSHLPSTNSDMKKRQDEAWGVVDKNEFKEMKNCPIGIYTDWEPNQQDQTREPVYEAYREDVTKETPAKKGGSLRSCRASVRSDLGLKAPGGVKGHWGLAGARSWRGRGPQQAVLWQDRDDVRKSGILQKLSHTEIQRQETMFEVFTSEESYLSSLCVLKDHFLGSRELIDTLVIHERKSLFSNILQVYEVSERFMADLHERVYENAVIPDVCDIIHHHAQNNFSAYTDYVRNQLYQEKTYTTLMQTNRPFAVVMKRLEESPLCQRLPFNSFLLLPFQRITRIKILIQSILKRTAENSKEEVTASKALACVSEIIKEANSQVGQMRQMEELIQIANMLEFDRLKAVPIVSKTRHLEKQGELQLMYKGSSLFNIGLKFTPVYLFLFNNLLILTNKKGPDRFVVMDHAHRSLVQVQTFGATDSNERAFCLTLLENHLGHTCEYIFKTETESDMHRWVAAFPSVSNLCEEEEEDTVYEDWDCPQFQCETEYTAQQADELSLEPGDIINVLRKTNEGWFEGVRLCDRQRGWFPQEYVSEITNEHQRRRNLREQYRIARAASSES